MSTTAKCHVVYGKQGRYDDEVERFIAVYRDLAEAEKHLHLMVLQATDDARDHERSVDRERFYIAEADLRETAPEPPVQRFNCMSGDEPPEGSRLVGEFDIGDQDTVEQGHLYLLPDNRYYYRYAVTIGRWSGYLNGAEYRSFADFSSVWWSQHSKYFQFQPGFEFLRLEAQTVP